MKPNEFYHFIGKIALIHAGIEYDMKYVLIEDWGILEEKISGVHGFRLRTYFLKKIKDLGISDGYYNSYEKIINRFWGASEKRNELIKATYGLAHESGNVLRYDRKARGEFDPEMEFKKWVEKGGKVIAIHELENLMNELARIRESFFQVSKAVYLSRAA